MAEQQMAAVDAVAARDGRMHALPVRRHPTRAEEVASYLVHPRDGTPLGEVVRAAGSRGAIEDTFEPVKGQAGRTTTRPAPGAAGSGTSRSRPGRVPSSPRRPRGT